MVVTPEAAAKLAVLIPLAVTVIYHDVRYRRIPNVLVLTALLAGLAINYWVLEWDSYQCCFFIYSEQWEPAM
jgi:Flp pilus assembly protein protease CpaA